MTRMLLILMPLAGCFVEYKTEVYIKTSDIDMSVDDEIRCFEGVYHRSASVFRNRASDDFWLKDSASSDRAVFKVCDDDDTAPFERVCDVERAVVCEDWPCDKSKSSEGVTFDGTAPITVNDYYSFMAQCGYVPPLKE